MNYKISSIVTSIKYGPYLKSTDKGSIAYLKGNHFDNEYNISEIEDSFVADDTSSQKHILKENDIIVAAKGFRNFAWRYTTENGPCVASSLFFVIRVDERIVLSEYFALLINSPRVQHTLKVMGMGVTIPSIPKNEFMRIALAIPSLDEQRTIIHVNNLMKEQIRIERTILNQQITLHKGIINLLTTTTNPKTP